MNAWLSRWDSRSASGDSPWSHVPSGANGGGTSTRTAGAPSARTRIARQDDLGQLHRPVRGVVRVDARQEQVVRAQVDHDEIHRMMGLQGDGQVRQPVAVGLERHVEHGGAAVLAFLDHVDVVAELTLQDARPPLPPSEALARGGVIPPGVRVAVAEDRGHATRRCRSVRSRCRRRACPARRPGSSRWPPPRRSRR